MNSSDDSQDKIDFSSYQAIYKCRRQFFRLLAENNVVVKDHLFSGHKYTSKMIQNEIRELYRVEMDHGYFQEKP